MKLKLISFKICPFVQRAVITLLHKKMPFEIDYIDLGSPPQWFESMSPFGKVPLLQVDDKHTIFESAIIDEFLDEICPGNLLPKDPVQRALDRSWIDFGSSLILDFSAMIHSGDAESYDKKRAQVHKEFDWLENMLGDGPFFNGGEFSLVDIAYAPLFMRTNILNLADDLYPEDKYPRISQWAKQLLSIAVLTESVVPDFESLFKGHLCKKAPYSAKRMGLM